MAALDTRCNGEGAIRQNDSGGAFPYQQLQRGENSMDADYSVELLQAFVIGEDELTKLGNLLTDRIGDLDIRADCADDASRMFKTIRELLAYENPKAKEIRRIHLNATSKDFSKRATIDLSGTRWRGLSLNFHASDDVVSRLRTKTLDIVAGNALGTASCTVSILFSSVSLHMRSFGLACLLLWHSNGYQ